MMPTIWFEIRCLNFEAHFQDPSAAAVAAAEPRKKDFCETFWKSEKCLNGVAQEVFSGAGALGKVGIRITDVSGIQMV